MLLAGLCCLVSVLIMVGNISTAPAIKKALERDQLDTLDQIIPAHLYNNNLLEDQQPWSPAHSQEQKTSKTLYIAQWDESPTAMAFPIVGQGYSGNIRMLLGVDVEGKILGVRVISHAETPGLGDKIEIAKDDWVTDFNGLSLANTPTANWAVKKDGGQFDQFTGATITPRAIVNAVHQGLIDLQDFCEGQADAQCNISASASRGIQP